MHDLKFAGEIVSAVRKHCSKNRTSGNAITVHVKLSPLSHVRPEGLNETFGHLALHESLANVKLDISALEFELRCNACGHTSRHSQPVFECPACGSGDFDINKDKEFLIDSIT